MNNFRDFSRSQKLRKNKERKLVNKRNLNPFSRPIFQAQAEPSQIGGGLGRFLGIEKNSLDQNGRKDRNFEIEKSQKNLPKLLIDHARTIQFNSRNLAIERFEKASLSDHKKSFSHPLCLLYNFFNVFHLALMQVSIASLPHSPGTLLIILTAMELLFTLLTLIPYIFHHRFLPVVELSARLIKSFCIWGFLVICLVINSSTRSRFDLRVNHTVQKVGIIFIALDIFASYFFLVVRVIIFIIKRIRSKFSEKNSNEKNHKIEEGAEDLTQTQRGLIFYKAVGRESSDRPISIYQANSGSKKIRSKSLFVEGERRKRIGRKKHPNAMQQSQRSKRKRRSYSPQKFKFQEKFEESKRRKKQAQKKDRRQNMRSIPQKSRRRSRKNPKQDFLSQNRGNNLSQKEGRHVGGLHQEILDVSQEIPLVFSDQNEIFGADKSRKKNRRRKHKRKSSKHSYPNKKRRLSRESLYNFY